MAAFLRRTIVARALLALAIGTLAAGIPVTAHHAFSASYLESQSVSVEGVVLEFQYRNPHAILLVKADDADGRTQSYAAEWDAAVRLAGRGITKDVFKPGDRVIVTGSPGRVASEHKISLRCVERLADGWSWTADRPRQDGKSCSGNVEGT
jgi:hypothetical protein